MIAAPCPIRWEQMDAVEDSDADTKRFCNQCSLNVFNVSNMTRVEAEKFLNEQSGPVCLGLYRRPDGTLITKDCPYGVKLLNRARFKLASLAASVLAVFGITLNIQPARAENPDPRYGSGYVAGNPVAKRMGYFNDVPQSDALKHYIKAKSKAAKKNFKAAETEFELSLKDFRKNLKAHDPLFMETVAKDYISVLNLLKNKKRAAEVKAEFLKRP
ncbi:MAG: hypothetical protein KIT34_18235 [Cyanobacteria bacterium TGS_CYA1]|nr:hypothetical protein [Cyanobacteria bacterium TGS_CYA1]